MAQPSKISRTQILKAASAMVENEGYEALSLRRLAYVLKVRAPSLYRYFADKDSLERAVLGEAAGMLLERLQPAASLSDAAIAYLEFARAHPHLYDLLMVRRLKNQQRTENETQLWALVLRMVGEASGLPDDTSGTVAFWAFLHGFASLEANGKFGKSGPHAGFERGLQAFAENLASNCKTES